MSNCARRFVYPIKDNVVVPTSRRKQMPPKRYRSNTRGDTFRVVLDAMTSLKWIDQSIGDYYDNRSTVVSAGAKLRDHIESRFVDPRFTRVGGAEIVVHEPDGGGAVFSVGSICWPASILVDDAVARITANVIRRFVE